MKTKQSFNDYFKNNSYSNVIALYSEMLQKLNQNNAEYAKTMLSNFSNAMHPLSNEGKLDVMISLQSIFTETLKNTQHLFENAQEIISSTKGQIMEAIQNQPSSLDQPPINLFKMWSDLNPEVNNMLQKAQDSIEKNTTTVNTKAHHKGNGIIHK